jgi:hypothetical protein
MKWMEIPKLHEQKSLVIQAYYYLNHFHSASIQQWSDDLKMILQPFYLLKQCIEMMVMAK